VNSLERAVRALCESASVAGNADAEAALADYAYEYDKANGLLYVADENDDDGIIGGRWAGHTDAARQRHESVRKPGQPKAQPPAKS
jgi:hypothetical protein